MAFGFFKNQLATVIEWREPQAWALLWKFPSDTDELKNASKLLVGPGQGALLVYEGQVRGVLDAEGLYTLDTANISFITTLLKLRTAFESEHKLKVYFYRQAENVNQNWGTAAPVKYLDPVYQLPVELGANGNLSYRVAVASRFFTQISGLKDSYTTAEARVLLQGRIGQVLAAQLAQAGYSYQQLDAHLGELAESLREPLGAELAALGLELTDFRISGTVFDRATVQRIGRVADATADNQAAAATGLSYAEAERLQALRDAMRTSGGLAGAGLQVGAGAELGKLLTGPTTEATPDPVQQLQKLKMLLSESIITQEEFDEKKKVWLDKL